MAQFDQFDEQTPRNWHSRAARERLDLSASVEATLADRSQGKQGPEEPESPVLVSKGMILIPPRLSLQSKLLPAVRPGEVKETPAQASPANADITAMTGAQHVNVLARIAQRISASLTSLGVLPSAPTHPGQPQQVEQDVLPQTGEAAIAHPVVKVSPALPGQTKEKRPAPATVETPGAGQGKQRLAGRTAKVRLETAPDLPEVHIPVESQPPFIVTDEQEAVEITTGGKVPAVETSERQLHVTARPTLSGSGTFESGCSEAVVSNKHITSSSVVVVMLTGDPGPVVVQYVSLQPQAGFTVHLSAPTKTKTSFNYVILLGEVF